MNLYAGIDPSSKSLTLAVVDSEGEIVFKPKNFPNSPSGADEIENTILSLYSSFNASQILVGIESTSLYDWHIANSIASSSSLSKFSIRVFRLSPYKINRFRKSTREVNKNDSNDAISIADYLRLNRSLPHPHVPADPYMPLRQLCRYHCHLVNTIASQTNVLINHLFLQHSAIVQNKAFKSLTSATSFSFFEEFLTPENVASTPLEELVSFLVKNSKNRFPDPNKIAQTLKAASRESYRIRPELASSNHFIIAQIILNIRTLKQSLKQVNKAIKEELKAFPNTLTSIPGVGDIYAAGIISEIGNISYFSSNDQIAKLAGLVWPEHQSASFKKEETRFLRTSNKYLRTWLIETANSVRRFDPVFGRYYRKKFIESSTHKHKRALILTARKLIRVIFILLKKNIPYQPASSFNSNFSC